MSRNDEAAARVGGAVAGTAGTVGRTEFTFDSTDGESQVRAVLWVPLTMERTDSASGEPELGCFKPRGVVQLIHGMAEHIDRYDDFARFLADAGYLVAGHDHIGHGETAGTPEASRRDRRRGRCQRHDRGRANSCACSSPSRWRPARRTSCSGIPWARSCCAATSRASGRGWPALSFAVRPTRPPPSPAPATWLPGLIAAVRGDDYRSSLLHALADGAYSRAIKDARTPFDWLSRDPAVADAFMADEAGRLHVRRRRLRRLNRAGLARQ